MLTALSDALQIARSMDAQEMQHRDDKMDRNAFHRALVSALSDPYTISGRATAENLKKLAKKVESKKDSFVLDARFELGKRDDAYLQAPVLPLQTADDDKRPLGMQLDPLFENAHRQGLYTALLDDLRGKLRAYEDRMVSALRLAGWLLTMPEVYRFVHRVLENQMDAIREEDDNEGLLRNEAEKVLRAMEGFEAVASDVRGEVEIEKLIKVGTKTPEVGRKIIEALALICENLTSGKNDILDPLLANVDPVGLAKQYNLCGIHGIHQVDDPTETWLASAATDAKTRIEESRGKGLLPDDDDSIKAFLIDPTIRNLRGVIEETDAWITDNAEAKKELLEYLISKRDESKPAPATFAYNLPKADYVTVSEDVCKRESIDAKVKLLAQTTPGRFDIGELYESLPDLLNGVDAKWTPLEEDPNDPNAFIDGKSEVARAVAFASCLELAIYMVEKKPKKPLGSLHVAARAKLEQLIALQTCKAHKSEFSGPGFKLPVLRCRALINDDGIRYYKFNVTENNLTAEELANTVEPKDFEGQVGLRDLSAIAMPKLTGVATLCAALHDGIDAAEELACNAEEQKKMKQHLTKLQGEKTRMQTPEEAPDIVDDTARKRRRDVWSDGLREAALSNDKLYSFARQLGGSIGEPMSEIAVIDDSKLAAESKQLRDARQRASQRAADQHADLVKNVIAQVMKDSQLTLGVSDQGSSFAGTSTGGPVDLTKIKIVSGALRREASELAGLGKDGETDRFFGNAVKLESLLRSGTGEMSMAELLAQLRVAGQQLQLATAGEMELDGIAGNSASIEYLSSPRNSLMLRWRPEALAAIREAFAHFKQEMRYASHGMATHDIRAYELIEGRDGELTTLFATLCGLKMASSRLHSSSQSAYTSKWAARSNSQQLGIALQRVCRQAKVYGMNGGGMGRSRQQYHR